MGELVRRLDYERRSSHLLKKDAKTRFLTKEFSQPVKSANALVQRSKTRTLANLTDEMKFFGLKHDQEKENLEIFQKGLRLKSVNFDELRFQQTRCRSSMVVRNTHELNADRLLRTVPSNYVLDFGPGNRPVYTTNDSRGLSRTFSASDNQTKSGRRTSLRSNRAQSAFSQHSAQFRQSVNKPLSRSTSADVQVRPRQGYPFARQALPSTAEKHTNTKIQKAPPLKQRTSSFSDSDDDSVFDFRFADEVDANEDGQLKSKQKSYRTLREEYSVKSKVLPDTHGDNLKRLKNIELTHLRALGERVHKFAAGIQALTGRRKYVTTTTVSPLRM